MREAEGQGVLGGREAEGQDVLGPPPPTLGGCAARGDPLSGGGKPEAAGSAPEPPASTPDLAGIRRRALGPAGGGDGD